MDSDNIMDELIKNYINERGVENITQKELFGKDGVVQTMKKKLFEAMLKAELSKHVGFDKNSTPDEENTNRRNGTYPRKIKTDSEELKIDMPRDREGTFDPILVNKYQRSIPGLDEKIISMYALGMSTRDIQFHVEEIYGFNISPELVSEITDSIIEEVQAWQNRSLDEIYPILFLDCIAVKCRQDNTVINKSVYLALAVNMEGRKELLGMYIAQTEGAKFWLSVITELKNRGVKDILIACVDGLKGFPEAINSVYPNTEVQLCIVHQIRNSLKFVSYKDRKELTSDLKMIYTANSAEMAEVELNNFAEKWDKKYAMISKQWRNNWTNIIPFFAYSPDIRKVIYTTNAIESLNHTLRKTLKTKGALPNDMAIFKLLYLSINRVSKKWTMPIRDWGSALSQLMIRFEDRFNL